jgi:hypothetical protein
MKIVALLATILMTGCSLFQPNLEDVPVIKTFTLTFQLLDQLPCPNNPDKYCHGLAHMADDYCVIQVDPDYYTHETLGHELRHCLEGHWHD